MPLKFIMRFPYLQSILAEQRQIITRIQVLIPVATEAVNLHLGCSYDHVHTDKECVQFMAGIDARVWIEITIFHISVKLSGEINFNC